MLYNQEKDNSYTVKIIADNNFNYFSKNIHLEGTQACYNFNKKNLDIYNGSYKIFGDRVKITGKADLIKQHNNSYTYFKNSSFTTCPLSKYAWNINGSNILYDHKHQIIKIWNSKFNIGKIPILYSPYMRFPIGNKNYSGFLMSNIKYCKNNGLEIEIPYYLSIAPNFDLTIKPKYMNRIGAQIQTEFRYLFNIGKGLIRSELIPKFINYDKNEDYKRKDFWLLRWKHKGFINQRLYFDTDYSKVNNLNYLDNVKLNRFDSTLYTVNGDFLQNFNIKYFDRYFDFNFLYRKFQILNINKTDNIYYSEPELDFNLYEINKGYFNFNLSSQIIKFKNPKNRYLNSLRIHSDPTVKLKFLNPWSSVNTEIKLMITHFRQENTNSFYNRITNFKFKKVVNRVIPQFKIDGKIILKKNKKHKTNYKQLLESRLQYLYIPYHKQNNIRIYDSSISEINHLNLFHYHVYNSFDRIAPAKQLINSIVTKIYDKNNTEIFNGSVDQIYHLYFPITNSNGINDLDKYNITKLILIEEANWRINNNLIINNSLQYNSYMKNITLESLSLEYKKNTDNIFQINYRYINKQYIRYLTNDNKKSISQIGIINSLPLTNKLVLTSLLYYDIKNNNQISKLINLQYNNYCWNIDIEYEKRKLLFCKIQNNNHMYDKKLSLSISINGLHKQKYNLNNKIQSFLIPYQQLY